MLPLSPMSQHRPGVHLHTPTTAGQAWTERARMLTLMLRRSRLHWATAFLLLTYLPRILYSLL